MQRIKQVLSGAVGLLMSGATLLSPALAADFTLGDFGTLTAANTVVVVGTDAKAADIVGAINVGAAVAQHGAKSSGGAASVEGAERKDVALTAALSTGFSTMDDSDLAGFIDSKVRWNAKDVDARETLNVGNAEVQTSETDKDFAENVFLGTALSSSSIKYSYTLDDTDLNISLVSATKPLEVTILGKSLKITEVGADQITVEEGDEAALGIGGTVSVNGKTLEVVSIGSTAVSVKVGTTTKIIKDTDDEVEIGATGLKAKVESILYTDDASSRQVLLKVGSDLATTIDTGDSMEMFGEPEETTDAMWVWGIDANASSDENKLVISAVHNQRLNSDTEAVVGVGGSIKIPNDYASISLDRLTADADRTYTVSIVEGIKVSKQEDGTAATGYDDVDAVKLLSSDDGKGFKIEVAGEVKETDTIYLVQKATNDIDGAFENKDGKIQLFATGATEQFNITYEDTDLGVTYANGSSAAVALAIKGVDDVSAVSGNFTIDADLTILGLGATAEDDDGTEIAYNSKDKGTSEESFRTAWGIVVETPKDNAVSDEVVFKLPSEQVKAQITVSGPEGATTVGGDAGVTQVSLGNGVAKLASEAEADKSAKNLILVGGPYANSLVAELATEGKTYSGDYWTANLNGKAIVQAIDSAFVSGKAAIVVAGWEAAQTRTAALKLMKGTLTGGMVEIQGETVTSKTYTAE